jgi:hypothetical protein
MKGYLVLIRVWIALGLAACAATAQRSGAAPDLVITHASVLDVRNGIVLPDRTVVIDHGMIIGINSRSQTAPRATRTLDARGRLVTPGLIDVHSHSFLYLPDDTLLVMTPDSIDAYRRVFASEYLPYGVTVVRDVGSSERVLPMLVAWMKPSADAPDFYPSGAHLISRDTTWRTRSWQVVVADSQAAAAKVQQYYGLGIRNIKLYWGLRQPEFKGALFEAEKRGMSVTGHIDQRVMTVGRALDLGLRNVEHVHTLALSVLSDSELNTLYAQVPQHLGVTFETYRSVHDFGDLLTMEFWNGVGPDNPSLLALIEKFKTDDASLTPTLHVFAQRLGLAYFESTPRDSTEDTSTWTAQQRERALQGYRIMVSYVKRIYDDGIRLNVGTDADDPGKATLSEMLLLHDAGISMLGVFKIATLDSAEDIGHGAQYGSIEQGKRADLILFDGNPIQNPHDLLAGKTIIKDGVVWSGRD